SLSVRQPISGNWVTVAAGATGQTIGAPRPVCAIHYALGLAGTAGHTRADIHKGPIHEAVADIRASPGVLCRGLRDLRLVRARASDGGARHLAGAAVHDDSSHRSMV